MKKLATNSSSITCLDDEEDGSVVSAGIDCTGELSEILMGLLIDRILLQHHHLKTCNQGLLVSLITRSDLLVSLITSYPV